MRADQHPSQPSAPADRRRFKFIEPPSSADDALGSADVSMTLYVTCSTFPALQRGADALQLYAVTLDLEPQELLLILLVPGAARRERLIRQRLAFVRARAPRCPSGCLLLAVRVDALVGIWNLVVWALSLAPLLLHH